MHRCRVHPAISHCSHLLLKIKSCYKNKSLAKTTLLVFHKLSVFWSAFGFFNITFIIPSHFIIVPYLTLWMLDSFHYYQSVKQCGSRSGLTFCRAWSGSNLFARLSADAKVAASRQRRVKYRKTFDTTFWLKNLAKVNFIWLQLFPFG